MKERKIKVQKNREKQVEIFALVVAILCIVVGVLFILFKDLDHLCVMLSLAVLFILFGAMHTIGYFLHITLRESNRFDFSFGLFNIIIGIMIMVYSDKLYEHFSLVVGLILMFKAVTWLQTSFELKLDDKKNFHIESIYALVLAALGFIFIIVDFTAPHIGTIYHGLSLIIEGGIEVYSILRHFKIAEKSEEETKRLIQVNKNKDILTRAEKSVEKK